MSSSPPPSVAECEFKLHAAVVKAILRSPPKAFSNTAHYVKRQQQHRNDNNHPPPPYYEDIKSIFDALNPKYNVISFSTIAKLFTIAAGNPSRYRCDECDAKDAIVASLRACNKENRGKDSDTYHYSEEIDREDSNNDDDDHNDVVDIGDKEDGEPDVLMSGGVTFKQFCSIGEDLRQCMLDGYAFCSGLSEHDRCLTLQHKIMETISAKKSRGRQKIHAKKNQQVSSASDESDIDDDDDDLDHSDDHDEHETKPKKLTNKNNNNHNNTKQESGESRQKQTVHKLQWFEVAFLKEARTLHLLERPDSDRLTSSYRQAPSFFRSSTASLLAMSQQQQQQSNNSRASPRDDRDGVVVAGAGGGGRGGRGSPPKPLEKKLPRSTAGSTIAPYYDKNKIGMRIAYLPTMERVSVTYQHHRVAVVIEKNGQQHQQRLSSPTNHSNNNRHANNEEDRLLFSSPGARSHNNASSGTFRGDPRQKYYQEDSRLLKKLGDSLM